MWCSLCGNTKRIIETVFNWTKAWDRPCPHCVGDGEPDDWKIVEIPKC